MNIGGLSAWAGLGGVTLIVPLDELPEPVNWASAGTEIARAATAPHHVQVERLMESCYSRVGSE